MDINCTYHCEHQANGKCNLMDVEHPHISNVVSSTNGGFEADNADCPYYNQKR